MFWLLVLDESRRFAIVAAKMVVMAPDEATARQIAASNRGDEGPEVWYDPEATSCVNLESLPDTTTLVVRDLAYE